MARKKRPPTSPETKAKIAASMRRRFEDADFRAQHKARSTAGWHRDLDVPLAPDLDGFMADLHAAYPQGMPGDVPVTASRALPVRMIAIVSSYGQSPAAACAEA